MKGYGRKQLRQQGIKVPRSVYIKTVTYEDDKLSSYTEPKGSTTTFGEFSLNSVIFDTVL